MKFTLTVDMDNAAFEYRPRQELRRILDQVRTKLRVALPREGAIMDVNGNRVGSWEIQ